MDKADGSDGCEADANPNDMIKCIKSTTCCQVVRSQMWLLLWMYQKKVEEDAEKVGKEYSAPRKFNLTRQKKKSAFYSELGILS